MGARGPVPAHSSELARPRERNGRGDSITKGEAQPVRWPSADQEWHKIARDLYNACKRSGQADFYQQSDIAILYSLCEDLSHYKNAKPGNRSAMMLQTIMSALSNLLVTEGDRRRVRIELQEPEADEVDAALAAIRDYEADLLTD